MPISHSAATELAQLLNGSSAGELIPELVRQGLQALIEAEAAAAIGADRHERTAQRRGHRNGSRDRLLATPAGDIQLRIPRFRTGSFFPSLLEPRRRVDRALWAVVMEAYVSGVSTRKVDELVAALGCESGISKSEVSRICQGLDTQVQAFLQRPLEFSRYPYVYLDATYLHGRDQARKQVISRAVIVAVGITATGQREVLGIEVPPESRLVGTFISEVGLPDGAVVSLVVRGEEPIVPDINTRIRAGDRLLIVTTEEVRGAAEARVRAIAQKVVLFILASIIH